MARRKNPEGKKLILAGGVGALALLLGRKAFARPRSRTFTTPTGCNPSPFVWKPGEVETAIEKLISQGEHDPQAIAVQVATQFYSQYPGGGVVNYPPGETPPAGVECVWASIVATVAKIMSDFDVPPQGPNWPAIIDPLVEDPAHGGTPTPGKFFQIRQDWLFYGTGAKAIIATALKNAGVPHGVTNRMTYAAQILCSPWNDALYGVPGARAAAQGPLSETPWRWRPYPPLAEHGRAIPNNRVHADNYTRMISGMPPRRSVTGVESHDGGGGHLAIIWLPRIEGGTNAPVVATNDDGSSGINPPKAVLELGMENVFPGNYGCSPWREQAEPLEL